MWYYHAKLRIEKISQEWSLAFSVLAKILLLRIMSLDLLKYPEELR